MDLNRAKILLDRYWNCVSTVEEEQQLIEFFNSNEVPDSLAEVAQLFKYYAAQKSIKLSDKNFDAGLLGKVQNKKSPRIRKLETDFQNYMRVAAVIVIVIGGSLVFRMGLWQGEKPPMVLVEDTFKTPEEAFAETKKAFELIAAKMNAGRIQTEKIKVLSEAEEKIRKH
jgi:hypothetical protein